jgi:hypothetical protein
VCASIVTHLVTQGLGTSPSVAMTPAWTGFAVPTGEVYSDVSSTAGPASSGSNVFGSPTLRPSPVSDRSDVSTLSLSLPSAVPPPLGRSLSSGWLIFRGYDTRFRNGTAVGVQQAAYLRLPDPPSWLAQDHCSSSASGPPASFPAGLRLPSPHLAAGMTELALMPPHEAPFHLGACLVG